MRCPSCGAELNTGEERCPACGQEVESHDVAKSWHRRGGFAALLVAAACLMVVGILAMRPSSTSVNGGASVSNTTTSNGGAALSERPTSTAGSEGAQSQDEETHEEAAAEPTGKTPGVQVRETVDEYTWEELGVLARELSDAPTDEDALKMAIAYHLCDSNGKLDGSQTKRFSMADGTEAQAQIMGFRHDQKTDGTGLAGISFITKDCVAMHNVNERDDNVGGWRDSAMRAWLNEEVLPALPDDLRNEIVAVDKLTNNVGRTDYTSCISKTSDMVWLVSMEEIVGVIEKDDWMRSALGNGWYPDEVSASDAYERLERLAWTILNLEGTQYQLFPDLGLDIYGHNPFLIKRYQGEVVQWWERNPSPGYTNNFHICHRDGSPDNTEKPQTVAGVAICFCL